MKTAYPIQDSGSTEPEAGMRRRAFTLVELLVVIAVIAILAAMSFPIMGAIKRSEILHRAQAELGQVETAIESYKTKLGYYPPDNVPPQAAWSTTLNWPVNQLYYELLGTTATNVSGVASYQTLDGSATIAVSALPTTFGANVTGFMNCARSTRGGDEAPDATTFLHGLRAGQFLAVTTPVTCAVLGANLDGPLVYQNASGLKLNPWRYNSSSPQHNPKSFDLWIDLTIGAKTYRVCNWSETPLIVSAPYPYP